LSELKEVTAASVERQRDLEKKGPRLGFENRAEEVKGGEIR
jgi:hypothetical protein